MYNVWDTWLLLDKKTSINPDLNPIVMIFFWHQERAPKLTTCPLKNGNLVVARWPLRSLLSGVTWGKNQVAWNTWVPVFFFTPLKWSCGTLTCTWFSGAHFVEDIFLGLSHELELFHAHHGYPRESTLTLAIRRPKRCRRRCSFEAEVYVVCRWQFRNLASASWCLFIPGKPSVHFCLGNWIAGFWGFSVDGN